MLTAGLLKALLKAAATAFDPDWAVVASTTYEDIAPDARPETPVVGWLTYLRLRLADLPDLPGGADSEQVDDRGVIISVARDLSSAAAEDGVRTAASVRELLIQAQRLQ